ncbi:MAG TPA: DJ-1/PfpI family protein [Candidatus Eisenbergiella merdipullorum]|uniref:DJ-1/PfpI family protein n=1 Tax=Candidatus Eisenbergiella merdipullorum TaxID=2838553 RepID=A0A9D2I4E7_9FIRM|nr:DJ-1/PfpI family protein [Candidatus Eisenbergiella merdipullorum]
MSRIGVFFAEGYEEIEALTVVDLARRAGIEVDMISVENEAEVKGSHGITVKMDRGLSETDFSGLDMLVLPGGKKGTQGLESCGTLMEQLDAFYEAGRPVAAICAAPSIFGHRGYLKGRRATSYPSFEDQLDGARITHGAAETDGNVITGRGMGCSIPFALAVVEYLAGKEEADRVAGSVVYER